ncbi:MAG TPA: PKD domain-containing protein [Gemmatimonadales bacterium]|nr:PKD domain-containing protein [Gemmatimonadales bacterium]
MLWIGRLAAVAGVLVLAASCSDGSGIENEAPVANFDLPSCFVGSPCTFTSTSSDDEQVTSWSWDFNGDGTADASTASAAYQYQEAAEFNVSLTVRDAQGLSATKTSRITVAVPVNTPPTAGFTYSCNAADCTFVSTSSDAAPGSITTYAWNFGDEGTADVSNPSHSYTVSAPTEFTVTLTVTDNEGATAAATQTITVSPGNSPPTAAFTHSCNVAVCAFVSTSTDAAPGTVVGYAWSFGDGATADVKNPSHSYTISAVTDFTVTLTVTDNDGATAVVSKTITVNPIPPVNTPPTAGFTYACNTVSCTFASTSTDAAPGTIAAYAWTFGDGAVSDLKNPTHSYSVSAVTDFTVTLTVTDNEGATAVESKTITINPVSSGNIPPTASFTPWCHGESCIFTSTSTDVAPGTIVSYAWTFGDGATEDWRKPSHIYNISGRTVFTVTLTVTDNEGATAVATRTVSVTPLPPAVQGCTTAEKIVECVLDIPATATLKVTLLGISCDLAQRVTTPPPVGDQLFIAVCSRAVGDAIGIFGGEHDELWVYQAGSQARIWFIQGETTKRTLNPPEGRLEGNFPDWTIHIEDGDHAGAPGEPDFSDLILGVKATTR